MSHHVRFGSRAMSSSLGSLGSMGSMGRLRLQMHGITQRVLHSTGPYMHTSFPTSNAGITGGSDFPMEFLVPSSGSVRRFLGAGLPDGLPASTRASTSDGCTNCRPYPSAVPPCEHHQWLPVPRHPRHVVTQIDASPADLTPVDCPHWSLMPISVPLTGQCLPMWGGRLR